MSPRLAPLLAVLAFVFLLGKCTWQANNRHDDDKPRRSMRK